MPLIVLKAPPGRRTPWGAKRIFLYTTSPSAAAARFVVYAAFVASCAITGVMLERLVPWFAENLPAWELAACAALGTLMSVTVRFWRSRMVQMLPQELCVDIEDKKDNASAPSEPRKPMDQYAPASPSVAHDGDTFALPLAERLNAYVGRPAKTYAELGMTTPLPMSEAQVALAAMDASRTVH